MTDMENTGIIPPAMIAHCEVMKAVSHHVFTRKGRCATTGRHEQKRLFAFRCMEWSLAGYPFKSQGQGSDGVVAEGNGLTFWPFREVRHRRLSMSGQGSCGITRGLVACAIRIPLYGLLTHLVLQGKSWEPRRTHDLGGRFDRAIDGQAKTPRVRFCRALGGILGKISLTPSEQVVSKPLQAGSP